MPSVGPELPPHLAKRKRSEEPNETVHDPSKRQRSSSPHPHSHSTTPRRIIGPAAPPASLSERPLTPPDPDVENSDSDDDFGPSLPPAPGSQAQEREKKRQEALPADHLTPEASKKPQREEWMLVPPKQDDWSARVVDPTKLKNRKFNTGKGSKAPSTHANNGESNNALWTETPEQKRQRLEDEVMGVRKPAQLGGGPEKPKKEKWKEEEERETDRMIRAYNEKNRNTSLYDEHHHRKASSSSGTSKEKEEKEKEKEDDPSARAFDKEKDMKMGIRIGHAQKRELLNKAKDFGSRFEKGSYL